MVSDNHVLRCQVLSVVFRMDGCHFAGACQLLSPNAVSKEQAAEAASALVSVLQGRMPDTAVEKVQIPSEAYSFREFRTPTKHLLSALGNSLQQAMPSGFSFQSLKPGNPLRAAGPDCMRVEFDETEKALLTPSPPSASRLFFLWDSSSGESKPDYYTSEDFIRVTFSADEGTEATLLKHSSCMSPVDSVFVAEHALLLGRRVSWDGSIYARKTCGF